MLFNAFILKIKKKTDYDLTFVADLPGLKLENYVSDLLSSSIEVLNGKINLEIDVIENDEKNTSEEKRLDGDDEKIEIVESRLKPTKKNYTLGVGQKMRVNRAVFNEFSMKP